jgi:hypothetical protein
LLSIMFLWRDHMIKQRPYPCPATRRAYHRKSWQAVSWHARQLKSQAEQVWPWLLQVGLTRAGWYSYDILDNLGRRSARRIIPELQGLAPGDVVPMSPDGKQGMRVHSMDAPRSMVWGTPGETTWAWQLDPHSDGSTRLITRVRSRYQWLSPSIAFSALLEFGDIWMMRKMLLNIRDRAEQGAGVKDS